MIQLVLTTLIDNGFKKALKIRHGHNENLQVIYIIPIEVNYV